MEEGGSEVLGGVLGEESMSEKKLKKTDGKLKKWKQLCPSKYRVV